MTNHDLRAMLQDLALSCVEYGEMTQNRDFSSVYSLASRIMTALLEDTAMMADQCDEENKQ